MTGILIAAVAAGGIAFALRMVRRATRSGKLAGSYGGFETVRDDRPGPLPADHPSRAHDAADAGSDAGGDGGD